MISHRIFTHFQTGNGAPQNSASMKLLEESRLPSSHLPKQPSLICSGTQFIFLLPEISLLLTALIFTNQELAA